MITLAFDTATDRCTVAASDGTRVAHAFLDGSRSHAAAIITLLDDVLREIGAGPRDIGRLVVGDGPGSFTGLRVAAAVAKALTWHRNVEWLVASSLLVRAAAHAPANGGVVLAMSDALRGELYTGCWRITSDRVELLGAAPRAVTPAALVLAQPVDVVVGTIPLPLISAVQQATGREPIIGDAALPDARVLLAIADLTGAVTHVTDLTAWGPVSGRPAEAQAVWELKHGTGLPVATGIAR